MTVATIRPRGARLAYDEICALEKELYRILDEIPAATLMSAGAETLIDLRQSAKCLSSVVAVLQNVMVREAPRYALTAALT
jgi:hypothetical protein